VVPKWEWVVGMGGGSVLGGEGGHWDVLVVGVSRVGGSIVVCSGKG
jgi:hypothetical protein